MAEHIHYIKLIMSHWLYVFLGLSLTIALEYVGFGSIRKKAVEYVENNPPDEYQTKQREEHPGISDEKIIENWQRLIRPGDEDPSGEIKSGGFFLGTYERIFFYFAFLFLVPELIIGWLAFKVASKWEVWQNIVKVPPTKKEDAMVDLVGRRMWGSRVLQSFLVGTLGNIIAALSGVFLTLVLVNFS